MDAPAAVKPVKIRRWLPYWAVFQNDVTQTLHSWVYRTWVLVTLLAGGGYLFYQFGVHQEAGIIQPASQWVGELLRWTVLGSVTLIILLTVGSISAERGSMADSVLSRGISRYQYFLGKLHARLLAVLLTYFLLGAAGVVGSYFLLQGDLSWEGSAVALATVAAVLAAVVTCGVTASALFNNTLLGSAVLWVLVYGVGFALGVQKPLDHLQYVLQGKYDLGAQLHFIGYAAALSVPVTLVGMLYFARRDV
ncbi:MAG TPA: ABC transporter permease [Gemmataceae bacterium]|nr:ABC transporter permease [Gemmataceae bacterium]